MRNKEAVIYFHIPFALKANLETEAKNRNLSMTKLINHIITESLKIKKTGRGNRAGDHQLVIDYLRSIHPETARKITISQATGIKQNRVLIILNNLSGLQDTYSAEGINSENIPFLIYETGEKRQTEYGIAKDIERGLK